MRRSVIHRPNRRDRLRAACIGGLVVLQRNGQRPFRHPTRPGPADRGLPPRHRRQVIVTGAHLVDAQDGVGGADFGQPGADVSGPDVLETRFQVCAPEGQQFRRDLASQPHQLGPQGALDEDSFGSVGVGFGGVFAPHARRDAVDVEDLLPVKAPPVQEIHVLLVEPDALPLHRPAAQEGRAPFRAAIRLAPFTLEPFKVTVAHKLGHVHQPGGNRPICAEGVAVPAGHRVVGLHRDPRSLQGAEAVVVAARVPAPEVDHLHRRQWDLLPGYGVDIPAHVGLLVRHHRYPVRAQRPDLRRAALRIPDQEPVGVAR